MLECCRGSGAARSTHRSGRGRGREPFRGRSWSGRERSPRGPGRGSPGPAGPRPRSGALGARRLRQLCEGGRIGDSELGENLPVDPDSRLLEAVHEHRVREPDLATRRIDANDPECARPPLLLLASLVGERSGTQHGLGCCAIQLAPSTEVPLRLLEDFLPALAGLRPPLGPWHVPVSLIYLPAVLQIGNQNVEPWLIGLRDHHGLPQLPLALWRLALEHVPLPAAPPLELAGRGALEPLGRGALRFHLGLSGVISRFVSG